MCKIFYCNWNYIYLLFSFFHTLAAMYQDIPTYSKNIITLLALSLRQTNAHPKWDHLAIWHILTMIPVCLNSSLSGPLTWNRIYSKDITYLNISLATQSCSLKNGNLATISSTMLSSGDLSYCMLHLLLWNVFSWSSLMAARFLFFLITSLSNSACSSSISFSPRSLLQVSFSLLGGANFLFTYPLMSRSRVFNR